jgi:glycosyltransferase involved in cell wall biosynthesis
MSRIQVSLIKSAANSNALNVAVALSESGILSELITTLAYNPKGLPAYMISRLPEAISRPVITELERRLWSLPGSGEVKAYIYHELIRLILIRIKLNRLLNISSRRLVDWVSYSMDEHAAKKHIHDRLSAVYCYEDEAAATFKAAKQLGIYCFYDLPIAFYKVSQAIHLEEAYLFPELDSALTAAYEPAWKLERKEQEVSLADHIFVPSSFVRDSLTSSGIDASKICVVPFGAPTHYFGFRPKPDNKFRVIFAGRISPRKGIHYLLKAWENLQLPNAELLLVGSNRCPEGWLEKSKANFKHIPSTPHFVLNDYYSLANVLVLPSLIEGLALVQLEAMACGIPIITTPNAGGSDIIQNGVEGFIIPIRSVDALQEKLEWCYQNQEVLAEMGKAARRRAEQLTWEQYRQTLVAQIQHLIS